MPSDWISYAAWIDNPAGREEVQKSLSGLRIMQRAGQRQTQGDFAMVPG